MKLDLHLHTPASVANGDSIKWESTLETIKKLHIKGVKAFAFTDHNAFGLHRFLEAREMIKNRMTIFPAVEVDILKENEKNAHMLVIFSNLLSNEELKDIEEICRKDLHKRGIRIGVLNEIFKNYDTIRIPHVGKSDFFTPEELEGVQHDAIETTSVENPNYISWLKKRNDKSIVAFSDTHVWRDYPQNSNLYTDIDFDGTFKDLKEKLSLNKNYTKETI